MEKKMDTKSSSSWNRKTEDFISVPFKPIHHRHLVMANHMVEFSDLD